MYLSSIFWVSFEYHCSLCVCVFSIERPSRSFLVAGCFSRRILRRVPSHFRSFFILLLLLFSTFFHWPHSTFCDTRLVGCGATVVCYRCVVLEMSIAKFSEKSMQMSLSASLDGHQGDFDSTVCKWASQFRQTVLRVTCLMRRACSSFKVTSASGGYLVLLGFSSVGPGRYEAVTMPTWFYRVLPGFRKRSAAFHRLRPWFCQDWRRFTEFYRVSANGMPSFIDFSSSFT